MNKVAFPGVAVVSLIEALVLVIVDWSKTNLGDYQWAILIPPLATLLIKIVGLWLQPDPDKPLVQRIALW